MGQEFLDLLRRAGGGISNAAQTVGQGVTDVAQSPIGQMPLQLGQTLAQLPLAYFQNYLNKFLAPGLANQQQRLQNLQLLNQVQQDPGSRTAALFSPEAARAQGYRPMTISPMPPENRALPGTRSLYRGTPPPPPSPDIEVPERILAKFRGAETTPTFAKTPVFQPGATVLPFGMPPQVDTKESLGLAAQRANIAQSEAKTMLDQAKANQIVTGPDVNDLGPNWYPKQLVQNPDGTWRRVWERRVGGEGGAAGGAPAPAAAGGGGGTFHPTFAALPLPAQQLAQDPMWFDAAKRYPQVHSDIARAIAWQESSFDPRATGVMTRYGKARGLGQFIPETGRRYGIDDTNWDRPEVQIPAIYQYMTKLLAQTGGDIREALARYHGLGKDPLGETGYTYADKVLAKARILQQQRQGQAGAGQGAPAPAATPPAQPPPAPGAAAPAAEPQPQPQAAPQLTPFTPPPAGAPVPQQQLGETAAPTLTPEEEADRLAFGEPPAETTAAPTPTTTLPVPPPPTTAPPPPTTTTTVPQAFPGSTAGAFPPGSAGGAQLGETPIPGEPSAPGRQLGRIPTPTRQLGQTAAPASPEGALIGSASGAFPAPPGGPPATLPPSFRIGQTPVPAGAGPAPAVPAAAPGGPPAGPPSRQLPTTGPGQPAAAPRLPETILIEAGAQGGSTNAPTPGAPPVIRTEPLFPEGPSVYQLPSGEVKAYPTQLPTDQENLMMDAAAHEPTGRLFDYIKAKYPVQLGPDGRPDPASARRNAVQDPVVRNAMQTYASDLKRAQAPGGANVAGQVKRVQIARAFNRSYVTQVTDTNGNPARNGDGSARIPLDALSNNQEWIYWSNFPGVSTFIGQSGLGLPPSVKDYLGLDDSWLSLQQRMNKGDTAAAVILMNRGSAQNAVRALGDVGNLAVAEQDAVMRNLLPSPKDSYDAAVAKFRHFDRMLSTIEQRLTAGQDGEVAVRDVFRSGGYAGIVMPQRPADDPAMVQQWNAQQGDPFEAQRRVILVPQSPAYQ
jgi:hypothetical protein